jgi:hypothetical protein
MVLTDTVGSSEGSWTLQILDIMHHSQRETGLCKSYVIMQPFWVPDSDAMNCMICAVKFTVVKVRT